MPKKKISKKLDSCSKNTKNKKTPKPLNINLKHPDISVYDPIKNLLDKKRLMQVILECFENNDFEGILEVINIHLETKRTYSKTKKTKREQPILIPKNRPFKAPAQATRASLIAKTAKRSPR